MFAGSSQLLLRIWIRNSEATDTLPVFLFFLTFNASAADTYRTAVLVKVETQVHSPIEQIGENVFSFIDLFIVFRFLSIQRGEMQRGFIFRALIRNQL